LRREGCRPGRTGCRRTPNARGGFCGWAVGPSTSGAAWFEGPTGKKVRFLLSRCLCCGWDEADCAHLVEEWLCFHGVSGVANECHCVGTEIP
jgi:hypothetical protein